MRRIKKDIDPALLEKELVQRAMWEMEYTCTMCARTGEKGKLCVFCGGTVVGHLEHSL